MNSDRDILCCIAGANAVGRTTSSQPVPAALPPELIEIRSAENEALYNLDYATAREKFTELRAEEIVESAVEQLKAAGLATTPIIKVEEPKRLLLSEAGSRDADCVFIGARGLSRFERLLLGSVSTAVVTRAHCSVEVVRAR